MSSQWLAVVPDEARGAGVVSYNLSVVPEDGFDPLVRDSITGGSLL